MTLAPSTTLWATLFASLALLAVACAAPSTPTPPPPAATAEPTTTPTPAPPTPTATPIVERTPKAQALRLRAEAFTLARTEARFEDTYLFAAPALRDICDFDAWFFALIGEASFTRGWNNLDDDAPLVWSVKLVEVNDENGSTAVSVATDTERGLDLFTHAWAFIDDTWWINDPPEEACVL